MRYRMRPGTIRCVPVQRDLSDNEREFWLSWLAAETRGNGLCGFDRNGWESSRWVLHSIREDPSVDSNMTLDDLNRQRAAMSLEERFKAIRDDEAATPSEDCKRVRWSELAERLGVEFAALPVPPCYRWFPHASWPAAVWGPSEGSLDHESLNNLGDFLVTQSPDGEATNCIGYLTPIASRDFDRPHMSAFRLGHVRAVAATGPMEMAPSNWWPVDKSWFVYTDGICRPQR